MDVTISDVSIRCMGCSQLKDLQEAGRSGWKICEHCNFVICEQCFSHLEEPRLCLSYLCMQRKRQIKAAALPVEKILIFAREHNRNFAKKGLLYKLFYEEGEQIHSLPFFIAREKGEPGEGEVPTQVQQEVWKNFQLVITRRRGGKFVTWEKVI